VYKQFFGLTDDPFPDRPDPLHFCNTSEVTKTFTGLMLSLYERTGLIVLTGEPGTGKTALLKTVLDRLDTDLCYTAFIPDPRTNTRTLLDFLLSIFGIEHQAPDVIGKLASLKRWLLKCSARNETVVLLIDDAQALPPSALEQVRLLNSLETPQQKLLQIVLAGSPEIEAALQRPELAGLRRQVAHWSHTRALSLEDTNVYIAFGLRTAGGRIKEILTPETVACIYKCSKGVPRLINLLCTRAMIAACASGEKPVSPRTVQTVAEQLQSNAAPVDRPLPDPTPIKREKEPSPAAEVPGGKLPIGSRSLSAEHAAPESEVQSELPEVPPPPAPATPEPSHSGATVSPAADAATKTLAAPPPNEKGAAGAADVKPKSDSTVPAHGPAGRGQPAARRRMPLARSANTALPPSRVGGIGLTIIKWIGAVLLIAGAGAGAYYVRQRTNLNDISPFSRPESRSGTELDSRQAEARTIREPSTDVPPETLPEPGENNQGKTSPTSTPPPSLTNTKPRADLPPTTLRASMRTATAGTTSEGSAKPAEAQVGIIEVTANVPGAQISLDGRSDPGWVAPHSFAHLPAGTYTVLVAKNGYRNYEQTVEVEAGSTRTVTGMLTPQTITVNIRTTPPGAEVAIDGQPHGASPVETTLLPGQHTYAVSHAGFEPASGSLSLDNQESVTKIVELQPIAPKAVPANIQISTTPPGAKVYVDGTPAAGVTPASFRIAPGNHTLIFALNGYRAARRDISVPAQGTVAISQPLVPK